MQQNPYLRATSLTSFSTALSERIAEEVYKLPANNAQLGKIHLALQELVGAICLIPPRCSEYLQSLEHLEQQAPAALCTASSRRAFGPGLCSCVKGPSLPLATARMAKSAPPHLQQDSCKSALRAVLFSLQPAEQPKAQLLLLPQQHH